MKRFFVVMLFSLLVFSPTARADGPDDQYVTIYNLIQQGDMLNEKGQSAAAVTKYAEAESELKKFQVNYPDWNLKVVKYRLKYLDGKITQLTTQPPPKPAMATNAPEAVSTNSPATESTNSSPAMPNETAPSPSMTNAPANPAPESVKPAMPPQGSDLENQIKNLQEQVRTMEADKALLQTKLKEALAAQPAAVDPQQFAQAQAQINALQKENELLKASLAENKTNISTIGAANAEKLQQNLADANSKVSKLTEANAALALEKEALLSRVKSQGDADPAVAALRDENSILKKQVTDLQAHATGAGSSSDDLARQLKESQAELAKLQSDKQILELEKIALEKQFKQNAASPMLDSVTSSKIAQLEAQRDELQKSLDTATKALAGHKKGKEMAARIDQMSGEMAVLHARIDVLEAHPVPYSAEELALFSHPDMTLMATARKNIRKASRELPPNATVMLSEAKRYFVAGDLNKAEAKYLELLKLDEKNVGTLADLASIQVELGHLDDAEKNVRTALSVESNDDYSLFILGQIKFREKNYDEAFNALSHAAEINPQNARIQNFLGLTLSEKGLRVPAETAFRRAIQTDPGFAEAHVNLAVVYITQQPPLVELAKWHYQKALAAGLSPNLRLEKLLDPTKAAALATP